MTTPNDSLIAIANDLDQLADEVEGNESRPSADDIAARVKQAAMRLRALPVVDPALAAPVWPDDHDLNPPVPAKAKRAAAKHK